MTKQQVNTLSGVLGLLGILFMMAMAFEVFVPRNYSLFFGVACFILAAGVRRFETR